MGKKAKGDHSAEGNETGPEEYEGEGTADKKKSKGTKKDKHGTKGHNGKKGGKSPKAPKALGETTLSPTSEPESPTYGPGSPKAGTDSPMSPQLGDGEKEPSPNAPKASGGFWAWVGRRNAKPAKAAGDRPEPAPLVEEPAAGAEHAGVAEEPAGVDPLEAGRGDPDAESAASGIEAPGSKPGEEPAAEDPTPAEEEDDNLRPIPPPAPTTTLGKMLRFVNPWAGPTRTKAQQILLDHEQRMLAAAAAGARAAEAEVAAAAEDEAAEAEAEAAAADEAADAVALAAGAEAEVDAEAGAGAAALRCESVGEEEANAGPEAAGGTVSSGAGIDLESDSDDGSEMEDPFADSDEEDGDGDTAAGKEAKVVVGSEAVQPPLEEEDGALVLGNEPRPFGDELSAKVEARALGVDSEARPCTDETCRGDEASDGVEEIAAGKVDGDGDPDDREDVIADAEAALQEGGGTEGGEEELAAVLGAAARELGEGGVEGELGGEGVEGEPGFCAPVEVLEAARVDGEATVSDGDVATGADDAGDAAPGGDEAVGAAADPDAGGSEADGPRADAEEEESPPASDEVEFEFLVEEPPPETKLQRGARLAKSAGKATLGGGRWLNSTCRRTQKACSRRLLNTRRRVKDSFVKEEEQGEVAWKTRGELLRDGFSGANRGAREGGRLALSGAYQGGQAAGRVANQGARATADYARSVKLPTRQEILDSQLAIGVSSVGKGLRDTIPGLAPVNPEPAPDPGDAEDAVPEADGDGEEEPAEEDADSTAPIAEAVPEVDPVKEAEEAQRQERRARRRAKLALKSQGLEPVPPSWDPELWCDENAAVELHTAALQNDALRIRFLLHGLDVNRRIPADLFNASGETAAVCAARAGCALSCAALLDGGANPLARDRDPKNFGDGVWPPEGKPDYPGKLSVPSVPNGRTVIYHLRRTKILDEVLGRVFPLTRVSVVCAIAEQLSKHYEASAMLVAIKHDSPELLRLLLSQSAMFPEYMQQTPKMEDDTPRTDATTPPPREVSPPRALIKNCMRDRDGRAEALLGAVQQRRWKCVEVLLEAGVPRSTLDNTTDANGRNALHLAAVAGQAALVRRFLGKGASHSVYSKLGRQPIHDAAAFGYADVVVALVQGKADVLALTREIQDLRSLDATPDKPGGRTAYEIAEAKHKTAVCDVLRPKEQAAMERRATMSPQAFAKRDTWVAPATLKRSPLVGSQAAPWHTGPVVVTMGSKGSPIFSSKASPLFSSKASPLSGSRTSPVSDWTVDPRASALGSSLRSSAITPSNSLHRAASPADTKGLQQHLSTSTSMMGSPQRHSKVSTYTPPPTRATMSVGAVAWGPLATAGHSTLAASRPGSRPARVAASPSEFAVPPSLAMPVVHA